MLKYWLKNRLVLDAAISLCLVALLAFAFILPIYGNIAESGEASAYSKNEKIDFDVPQPGIDQIAELEGKSFIKSVFPYYYTNIKAAVGEVSRDIKLIMYEPERSVSESMFSDLTLIERMQTRPENPIYVDRTFALNTGAKLGDTVSVTLGATRVDFQIYQINESCRYYSGGVGMAEWSGAQKAAITSSVPTIKYSGVYINASDHTACKRYLEEEYRPLGRLKDPSEFSSPEAYSTHYYNIMASSVRNEITDFSVKRTDASSITDSLGTANVLLYVFAGVAFVLIMVASGIALWYRSSERGYFSHRKMSGDGNVKAYYLLSFAASLVLTVLGSVIAALVIPSLVSGYVPTSEVTLTVIVFGSISAVGCILSLLCNIILEGKIRG